ncbi:MAG: hypothetical protein WC703_01505 [Candidatus Neomarinimicrobiota bacterium]
MKMKATYFFLTLLMIFSFVPLLFGQSKMYDGPDDPAGDVAAIREGYMIGNRVFLYFQNTTMLSDWPKVEVSKWPNTYEGTKMLDGIALLVGALVFLKNDSFPVTDPMEILYLNAKKELDTLFYLQTYYREEMDMDPLGLIKWGLYPVFGYFNENNEYPAMSNLPQSWPPLGWPARGDMLIWPGEWNGRFGRGVIYADMETYFVANDAQDLEYLGPEDIVRYYPRPGKKIGDKRPDVTIQKGKPWGGIGIRVEQRGFQWNNPQARDALFWEYVIANISDYDLKDVAFGYWVDNAIGNDGVDELGYFDRKLDMAYSWDIDGIGQGGLPTGIMGFAYLESPGLAYDEIDNDEDGLTDEKRDNTASSKVDPYYGITNLTNFLDFYHLEESDLTEHWDADEDGDWQDGEDLNGDGVYQLGENAGDDVGLDGVGPGELNYTAPDEGECNHRPDFEEGVGCEPNFARTDVSESDMVGLTSFMLFPIQPHTPPYKKWFRNDKSMWQLISSDTLIEYLGSISNLVETFASGPFPLYRGRTERISMAEMHSFDPLEGLNSDQHTALALFELKKIVQVIYEKDYRFAQPPKMPTLSATPGDGVVILTWDDMADTKTRDPFLENVNDFEGYKLFRATDKKMSDAEVITDGYGTPMFKKPIFQCDLADNISGFTNFGLVNGMGYYLGNETGIQHYFIDKNVQNGRTYYYGIVAYDYGAPDIGPGIAPSENNMIIELDEAEEIRTISKNVQVATPHQMAAGYVPEEIEMFDNSGILGQGTLSPEILAKKDLQANHVYGVTFEIDTIGSAIADYPHGVNYTNDGFRIYDLTDTELVYIENPENMHGNSIFYDDLLAVNYLDNQHTVSSDVFEGLRINLKLPNMFPAPDYNNTGWVVGSKPILVTRSKRESLFFPWDYDIVFSNQTVYTGRNVPKPGIRDDADVRISPISLLYTTLGFNFYVVNKSFRDSTGALEKMDLVGYDSDKNGKFEIYKDKVLVGPVTNSGKWAGTLCSISFPDSLQLPADGDVYRMTNIRPYWITDTLKFTIKSTSDLDKEALKYTMSKIQVVPNPYVGTNAMEPSVANWYLNQRRKLMFTHLPALCTIKIFTVSGVLVDVINVNNDADNGIVHWDMLTKENLEIAAGMYLYHIKSKATGDEKVGKFAVIK